MQDLSHFLSTAAPRVRAQKKLRLALTVALALAGTAAAASDGCVLQSVNTLSPPGTQNTVGQGTGLKLLQTTDSAAARLVTNCSGAYLSEIRIQIEPGERRLINLVAEDGVLMPLNMNLDDSGQPASGGWHIVLRAISVDAFGEFQPRHFRGDQPALAQLIQIEITADASNRPGQQQRMRIGDKDDRGVGGTLLIIEDAREESMFRDQFRIDPTVGQFSHRTSEPINAERDSATINGSSDL